MVPIHTLHLQGFLGPLAGSSPFVRETSARDRVLYEQGLGDGEVQRGFLYGPLSMQQG